jgi:hypothetical protein
MSDERMEELGLRRRAFMKRAGAVFLAPVIVSFGLDGVAEAHLRHFHPNQMYPNQACPNMHHPNQRYPNQAFPNQHHHHRRRRRKHRHGRDR